MLLQTQLRTNDDRQIAPIYARGNKYDFKHIQISVTGKV